MQIFVIVLILSSELPEKCTISFFLYSKLITHNGPLVVLIQQTKINIMPTDSNCAELINEQNVVQIDPLSSLHCIQAVLVACFTYERTCGIPCSLIYKKTEQNEIARATKSNPKKFWAYVKNKTVLKSSVGDLKTIDNGIEVTITDDMEKASAFCKYFSTVFTKVDASHEQRRRFVSPSDTVVYIYTL